MQLPLLRTKGFSLAAYLINLAPKAYWKLDELTGTTIKNYGTLGSSYDGSVTGATLASTPAPGGGLAPRFDGTNDNVSARLSASLFHAHEGTSIGWFKAFTIAVWDDTIYRMFFGYQDGGGTYFGPVKNSADGLLYSTLTDYLAFGGMLITARPTGWFLLGLTWSQSNNRNRIWFNGLHPNSDGVYSAPPGFWDNFYIGESCPPFFPWNGYAAHVAIYDYEFTEAQMAKVYALGTV